MSAVVNVGKNSITTDEYLAPGHRACIGCGEELAVKLVCKALGKDTIIVNATGCTEIVSSPYPTTSWEVPWIHTLFENTAAVASGIEAGIKAMKAKGGYPSNAKVVAMGGDGATADIGLQALSGAMERRHNMIYVCFDNEGYMNTGTQRSSETPFGASTTTTPPGKKSGGQYTWKKNMPAIMEAHEIPYVATASPSYPFDLMKKVEKAKEIVGPSYLHILSVCLNGWRTSPDSAIEMGRLAVQTGVFPLYEVENGKLTLNVTPGKLRPVEEYLKPQGRFRHLTPEDITFIQGRINSDWEKLKRRSAE